MPSSPPSPAPSLESSNFKRKRNDWNETYASSNPNHHHQEKEDNPNSISNPNPKKLKKELHLNSVNLSSSSSKFSNVSPNRNGPEHESSRHSVLTATTVPAAAAAADDDDDDDNGVKDGNMNAVPITQGPMRSQESVTHRPNSKVLPNEISKKVVFVIPKKDVSESAMLQRLSTGSVSSPRSGSDGKGSKSACSGITKWRRKDVEDVTESDRCEEQRLPTVDSKGARSSFVAAHYRLTNNRRTKVLCQLLLVSICLHLVLVYSTYTLALSALSHRKMLSKSVIVSNLTLREFLSHDDGYYVAMGPAFFGFYAYFGALTALDDAQLLESTKINGVTGASAGAMAAVLIATGKKPKEASDFACSVVLDDFADPPGVFGVFQGERFEKLMSEFMSDDIAVSDNIKFEEHLSSTNSSRPKLRSRKEISVDGNIENDERSFGTQESEIVLLENCELPIAVSAFDLLRLRTKYLIRGNAAKAARASATFPGLLQPVIWNDDKNNELFPYSVLIDGGVLDSQGYLGLDHLPLNNGSGEGTLSGKRVLHILVGGSGFSSAHGPTEMMLAGVKNIDAVVSLEIVNTPPCGPLKVKNGPFAVSAARNALYHSLDDFMEEVGDNHYRLYLDATKFK